MQSQLQVYSCCCLVIKSCPTLCDPMDRSPPGPSVLGDSPGKHTRSGLFPPPGDLLHPGIEPASPALAGGFFPTAPAVTSIQIGISPHCHEAPSTVPLCRGEPAARKPTLCLTDEAAMAHSLRALRARAGGGGNAAL